MAGNDSYKVFKVYLKPFGYYTSTLPSYTVFGALCWALRYLGGEEKLEEFLDGVKSGSLFLSSLMPAVGEEEYLFRPLLKPKRIRKRSSEGDGEFRSFVKKFKKTRFLRRGVVEKVLKGEIKDEAALAEEFRGKENPASAFFNLDSLPHAKIDRLAGSTTLGGEFYFEESYYCRLRGSPEERELKLYFLVATREKDEEELFKDLLLPAVRLLEDWGIGGNRSIGFGSFEFLGYKVDGELSKHFLPPGESGRFLTLSPLLPTRALNYSDSYYDAKPFTGAYDSPHLVDKGLANKLWKDKVFTLLEGSVLVRKEGFETAGELYSQGKEDPRYHYLLEFPLRIKDV